MADDDDGDVLMLLTATFLRQDSPILGTSSCS